jgi:hypothetical protein
MAFAASALSCSGSLASQIKAQVSRSSFTAVQVHACQRRPMAQKILCSSEREKKCAHRHGDVSAATMTSPVQCAPLPVCLDAAAPPHPKPLAAAIGRSVSQHNRAWLPWFDCRFPNSGRQDDKNTPDQPSHPTTSSTGQWSLPITSARMVHDFSAGFSFSEASQ